MKRTVEESPLSRIMSVVKEGGRNKDGREMTKVEMAKAMGILPNMIFYYMTFNPNNGKPIVPKLDTLRKIGEGFAKLGYPEFGPEYLLKVFGFASMNAKKSNKQRKEVNNIDLEAVTATISPEDLAKLARITAIHGFDIPGTDQELVQESLRRYIKMFK